MTCCVIHLCFTGYQRAFVHKEGQLTKILHSHISKIFKFTATDMSESKPNNQLFQLWLVACWAPSQCLNKWWLALITIFMKIRIHIYVFSWNKNVIEKVVSKISANQFGTPCANWLIYFRVAFPILPCNYSNHCQFLFLTFMCSTHGIFFPRNKINFVQRSSCLKKYGSNYLRSVISDKLLLFFSNNVSICCWHEIFMLFSFVADMICL